MADLRACRRCLLADITDETALYALIRERVSLLPDGERAAEPEVRRRLALCKACGHLNRGTCAKCGCYVEIRAARRRMRCPHDNPKW